MPKRDPIVLPTLIEATFRCVAIDTWALERGVFLSVHLIEIILEAWTKLFIDLSTTWYVLMLIKRLFNANYMYTEAAVTDAYVFVRRPSLSFIISLRRVNNLQVLRT